jgi:hypothetical protein
VGEEGADDRRVSGGVRAGGGELRVGPEVVGTDGVSAGRLACKRAPARLRWFTARSCSSAPASPSALGNRAY